MSPTSSIAPPSPRPVDDLADGPRRAPGSTAPARSATAAALPSITSEALFGSAREVCIEHRGALYRLKLTSLGKLILTK